MRGKIFLLEGMDSSGKATHSKLFLEKLQSIGRQATLMSFPNYETMTGKAILGHLKNEWNAQLTPVALQGTTQQAVERLQGLPDVDALVLQSLMTMNRYEVAMDMDVALHAGTDIVLDRYWPSGYVYGLADGLPGKWLLDVHEMLPPVDRAVLLDIPPEESVRRRPERRDRYEKQAGLMDIVRRSYKRLFEVQAAAGRAWSVVDAVGTKEEVHQRICNAFLND